MVDIDMMESENTNNGSLQLYVDGNSVAVAAAVAYSLGLISESELDKGRILLNSESILRFKNENPDMQIEYVKVNEDAMSQKAL